MLGPQASKRVPPVVLDALMARNIQMALREHGLTTPTIIINCCLYVSVMLLVYLFAFFGFIAFTDPKDLDSQLLNDFILCIIVVISYQTTVAEADSEVLRDKIDVTTEEIMMTLNSVIAMVEQQIQLAETLVGRMRQQMDGKEPEEDYDSGSDGWSDDDDDPKKPLRGRR